MIYGIFLNQAVWGSLGGLVLYTNALLFSSIVPLYVKAVKAFILG